MCDIVNGVVCIIRVAACVRACMRAYVRADKTLKTESEWYKRRKLSL